MEVHDILILQEKNGHIIFGSSFCFNRLKIYYRH
jgi:hypothetical protein